MKHKATRELFAYWNELRGARAAPERGEIDPAAIREVLADTFMLDVDLTRRFPFRLAGTRVNGLFDAEQKGRSFLDIWRQEERRNLAAILCTVADGACPVVTGGVAAAGAQDECAVEVLLLPLRHHGRTHARILGLVKPLTRPAWIGLLPVGPISLRALRIIDVDECEAHRAVEKIAVGQSLAPASSAEPGLVPDGRPSRPHLRVIQGGR